VSKSTPFFLLRKRGAERVAPVTGPNYLAKAVKKNSRKRTPTILPVLSRDQPVPSKTAGKTTSMTKVPFRKSPRFKSRSNVLSHTEVIIVLSIADSGYSLRRSFTNRYPEPEKH